MAAWRLGRVLLSSHVLAAPKFTLAAPSSSTMVATRLMPRCLSTTPFGPGERMALNNIQDNPGARRKAKRLGRGPGSGKGKTSGRGQKGKKARAGSKLKLGHQGGQTALTLRIPKRGFNSQNPLNFERLNLDKLQLWIDMGRLKVPDDGSFLTMRDLVDSGVLGNGAKNGIKLLGNGAEKFNSKIRIEVSQASSTAIKAIEEQGGLIVCGHFNRLAFRALLHPEKFALLPRRARPPPKLMEYYTDYEKRGYLSAEMQYKLKQINDEIEATQSTLN